MRGKVFRLIAKCMVCVIIAVGLITPLTDFPDPITIGSVQIEINC